jgi:hypothetical protein
MSGDSNTTEGIAMTPQQAALDALTIGLKYTVEHGTHKEAMEIRAQIEALTQAQAVDAEEFADKMRKYLIDHFKKHKDTRGDSLTVLAQCLVENRVTIPSGAGLEALLAKVEPLSEVAFKQIAADVWVCSIEAHGGRGEGPTPTAAIEQALKGQDDKNV